MSDSKSYPEVMYRADYGEPVTIHPLGVVRSTEKCVYVEDLYDGRLRRCTLGTRKSYAYETKELAVNSLQARAARRIDLLEKEIRMCEATIAAIEGGFVEDAPVIRIAEDGGWQ